MLFKLLGLPLVMSLGIISYNKLVSIDVCLRCDVLASPSLAGNESNMNRTTQAAAICLITFIGMRTAISSFLSDLSFDSTLFGVGSGTLSAKIDLAPITTLSFIVLGFYYIGILRVFVNLKFMYFKGAKTINVWCCQT